MSQLNSLEQMLEVCKALADSTRLRLVHLLKQGELSVNEIVRILEQSQPRVSRHLKVLCEAGVLERFREQHHIYYRVPTQGQGQQLATTLAQFLEEDDAQIQHDAQRLQRVVADREKLNADYIDDDAPEWVHLHTLHGDHDAFAQAVVNVLEEEELGELLDIATGTGRMLGILGQLCDRGVGIDQSKKMANVARTSLQQAGLSHCTIRQDDMYQMQFDDQSFDSVTIDQVLYFAEQPAAVIDEAARVLKANGRLLLVAFTAARSTQDIELGISPELIKKWCVAAGLKPEAQKNLPGDLADIVLLVARKPSSKIAETGEQYEHQRT